MAILTTILFALSYVLAAEVGHFLSFRGNFATFWPPSGVYLAGLLLTERKSWPFVIGAALIGNVASDVLLHGQALPASLGFWVANTLQAATVAMLVQRRLGKPFDMGRLRSVSWLCFTGAGVGALISAPVGSAVVTGFLGGTYLSNWAAWWTSSFLGELLLTPTILTIAWRRHRFTLAHSTKSLEAGAFFIATALVGCIVFGSQTRPITYLVLPVTVWASIRLQLAGSVLTTVTLSAIAVWNTTRGNGPFVVDRPLSEQVLMTQGFLCVSTLVSLLLAGLTTEQQSASAAEEAARKGLEEANEQLALLASTDELTGLHNRRSFQARLEEEITRCRRYRTPLSLLLVDVDRFKDFNDSFGHPAGDEVLRVLSQRLHQSSRTIDFVARLGGEEFAILLPNTDEEGAVILAERIRDLVAEGPWRHRTVTISVGVSTIVGPQAPSECLMTAADTALYRSKREGRNRVSHARHRVETL
jgi:diguanylate cyclase (GGDEF)-like protein